MASKQPIGSSQARDRRFRDDVRRRLSGEIGALPGRGGFTAALAYPSPYAVGMSSLGYQRIYRALHEAKGLSCERAFLEGDDPTGPPRGVETYESLRPIAELPVIAASVAYELEIAGLARLLEGSGIAPVREERGEGVPFVLAGGPLTFSNPTPLGAVCDAVLLGEAEALVVEVMRVLEAVPDKPSRLSALARVAHVWVPALHGEILPPIAKVDDALLPAWGPIRAPEAELTSMFLIETERGCSRGCTYCVMRRSTNGGMRIVPADEVLARIPDDARRVGLVGAAVSDHPEIVRIVRTLADRGCEVGLSSLRPDKLKPAFVDALRAAGYRTLTTAMDGPSDRTRRLLDRRADERNLVAAAENARAAKMERLKLYLMIGIPGERDDDIDECVRFVSELSRIIPVSLGIAPFCPKRNTPLVDEEFAGIDVVRGRLDRLKRGLQGRADVRSTSAKWAWVEAKIAKGGFATGRACVMASRNGGTFAAYQKAFDEHPEPRAKLRVI